VNRLEASVQVNAPADMVFEALRDIRSRAEDVPAFQSVEIRDETPDGFVATMHEHYGGRDVVVTSRFRFERPVWLTYEHLKSPYGNNRGRFTITQAGPSCALHQVHETDQDVAEGTTLRQEWLALMQQQLEAIRRASEAQAAEA
jgi:ribosome-associated toxin RatA of RatAB toxin-antitoxin module